MNVLLIYPRARVEAAQPDSIGAVSEPLALEYISAGAKQEGHAVRLLDLRLRPEDLERTVREFRPDVAGLTGYSMHVLANLDVARHVKALVPDCVTVVGGHHATLLPEDFFEPPVDYVVSGEGVRPFRALLGKLETKEPVEDVAGVWARKDGAFVFGGEQPPFDVNALPPADRAVVQADRAIYTCPFFPEMKPVALVRTSVGCPYRCNFCALWKIMKGKYHMRDIPAVVEELASLEPEWISFVDDETFINGARMIRMAQAIKDAGIRKHYFAWCRLDTLEKERDALTAWRDIGLDRLFIGIEAISDKGQRDFNKTLEMAELAGQLKIARDLGVKVYGQFIVRPDFTRQDFAELVRFIEYYKIDYPAFTILTPIPGSEVCTSFDNVIEKQPNGRPNWDLYDLHHAVTETALPKEEFMAEYQQLRMIFRSRYSDYHKRTHAPGLPLSPGTPSGNGGHAAKRRRDFHY